MSSQNRRSLSPLEEKTSKSNTSHTRRYYDCRLCRKDHPLRRCIAFKKMNVVEKIKVVKRYRYCENCLAHSHLVRRCRNTERCRQCGGRHHTLLHRHKRLSDTNQKSTTSANPTSCLSTITLLPTIIAKVHLGEEWGNVRGILNPCVEFSSIAEFLPERYKIPVKKIGEDRWCNISIRPRFDDSPTFSLTVKITSDLPTKQPKESIEERAADLYTNLRLADPRFYHCADINIILGADIYPRLIKSGIQPDSIGSPMAQDTVLGWTIIGKFGV